MKKQLGALQDDVTKVKKTVLFNKGYMTAAKLGRVKVTSVNAYAACHNVDRANYHIRLHHYDEDLADDPLGAPCFYPGPP